MLDLLKLVLILEIRNADYLVLTPKLGNILLYNQSNLENKKNSQRESNSGSNLFC